MESSETPVVAFISAGERGIVTSTSPAGRPGIKLSMEIEVVRLLNPNVPDRVCK